MCVSFHSQVQSVESPQPQHKKKRYKTIAPKVNKKRHGLKELRKWTKTKGYV
jgi:hypothetical protein